MDGNRTITATYNKRIASFKLNQEYAHNFEPTNANTLIYIFTIYINLLNSKIGAKQRVMVTKLEIGSR